MEHFMEKQGYFADCYVLTNRRTKEFINSFLDKFVPLRHERSNIYEVPLYTKETKNTFETSADIIDYLIENKHEIYTIYWANNENSDIRIAMCFFTDDDNLIVGISCETMYPDTFIEDKVFNDLKIFCNSDKGYITYEEPTVHNTKEFLEIVKNI